MTYKIIILCIAVSIIFQPIFAQSPYQFSKSLEYPTIGIGVFSLGLGMIKKDVAPTLTLLEIEALDFTLINQIDRNATLNSSLKAGQQSDVLLFSSIGLPLFFFVNKKTRREAAIVAALWGEATLINSGLTLATKYSVSRIRPFVYNSTFSLEDKQTVNARTSFFSGHVSVVATNTFFIAKVFSDYYPNSKWKPVIWGTAILIPAATAYLRVGAGKHFLTDVAIGYIVGAACGYFIPALHKKKNNAQLKKITVYATPQQMRLLYNF